MAKFFCVFDTETTGLPDNKYAQPVQLAAVILNESGEEVDSFNCMVLPSIIDTMTYHHAERIHGISLLQLVKEGTPAATVADHFRAWWIGHGRPMLLAYHSFFDEEMLRRMGFEPKGYFGSCIMRAAAERLGRTTGRISLDGAVRRLSLQTRSGSHHHALEDARLAGRVAHALGMFA